MDTILQIIDHLNSLAGLGALINGLLLWPIVKSMRETTKEHAAEIKRLNDTKADKVV